MPPKKDDSADNKAVRFGRVRSNLKMGLVGLPNVGKSSLFNLLCQQEAEANQEDFGEEWDSRVVTEMTRTLPRIDGRAMASLAWMYARGRNPKYSREIFRQLRAAQEQQKRENSRAKG